MRACKRIGSMLVTFAILLTVTCTQVSAYEQGTASIGFSTGGIYYTPYGLSSVEGSLDLDFGNHMIDVSTPMITYGASGVAGYTVTNESGGAGGYTVTLGLSSFDNGLEGAVLVLTPDAQGAVSNSPAATSPPILLQGQKQVVLQQDDLSAVVMMEGKKAAVNPAHTAIGVWGFNFTSDLQVYTQTIRPGKSRAIMTWNLIID